MSFWQSHTYRQTLPKLLQPASRRALSVTASSAPVYSVYLVIILNNTPYRTGAVRHTTLQSDFYRATTRNATHGIAVAILSVCLSVRCVYCNKTESSVNISTPHGTWISLVFPLQRGLLAIVPFHPKYSPKVTHPFKKTPTSTDFRL